MLFVPPDAMNLDRWQYPTEAEASVGHEVIIAGLLADGYRIDPDQTPAALDPHAVREDSQRDRD